MEANFKKDIQYFRFCAYGFLKNLRFFEPFLMVFLLSKLDGNYTQIGFLYSIRFLLRALLEIPSGILADTLGRRNSMLFSNSLYIASFISYYLARNFYGLLIPTILFGIADAFRTGTHKAMIVDYLNTKGWADHKTDYYGQTRSWSQTGSAISSLIVFFIYIWKPDYGFIFLVTTIPYFIGLINLLFYPKYLDGNSDNKKAKKHTRLIVSFKESFQIISNFKNLKKITGTSLYFGYFHSVKDYIQPIILGFGLTIPFLSVNKTIENPSLILPLFYFGLFTITVLASRSAGKIRKLLKSDESTISILTALGGLAGILYAALEYFNYPILSLISFVFIYIIINIQRPSVVSFISSQFENKYMATILSVESQIGSIIAGLIAFITGILTDKFGLSIAIGIISLILILLSQIKWYSENEENNKRDSRQHFK